MKKRLFIYSTFIIFAGLFCFFAVSVYITSANNLSIAKDKVMETTRIYSGFYDVKTDAASFVRIGGDTRITVISPDGTVLADSQPLDLPAIENHLDRPEIQAAIIDSPAAYVRHSDTLGVDLIYYALKVDSGDSFVLIRAAIPVANIEAYLSASLPLLVVLFFVIALLCFALSRGMITRIIKPLGAIEVSLRSLLDKNYKLEPIPASYPELGAVIHGFDEVAQTLHNSFTALQDEKNKAEFILNNIWDGIFVVDEDKNVVMSNTAALTIFFAKRDVVGQKLSYLTFDKTLTTTVDACITDGSSAVFELVIEGKTYITSIKRLNDTALTIVVLSDVTDNRENAKQREEFFANASHELKTPLTAIKGFNELIAIHNRDENINKYIDSIMRETERMLSLIGDMLKLSELETSHEINPAPVSLSSVVKEVREALALAINEKAIDFQLAGDAFVNAEQNHVYELVKNLIENAVRYNEQNGRVSVTIESDNKNAWLFVFDDGIGISPSEQTRIFERFYRVEKSRSQRGGGTGLGLSIVKHICAIYGWKLSLKSKLGVGTEVAVVFHCTK